MEYCIFIAVYCTYKLLRFTVPTLVLYCTLYCTRYLLVLLIYIIGPDQFLGFHHGPTLGRRTLYKWLHEASHLSNYTTDYFSCSTDQLIILSRLSFLSLYSNSRLYCW